MAKRSDVRALKNMIDQSYRIVSSDPVLPGEIERCRSPAPPGCSSTSSPTSEPGGLLGSQGGRATLAKRGPNYPFTLASKRKTFGGGRPSKQSE